MFDALNAWAEKPLSVGLAIFAIGILYVDAHRKDREIARLQKRVSDLEHDLDYYAKRRH